MLIIATVEKLIGPFEKGQYCSAACILENMILTAIEMGIGTVFLSGVTTALNENREFLTRLGVPDNFQAASAIAVGRPAVELKERNLTEERIVTRCCKGKEPVLSTIQSQIFKRARFLFTAPKLGHFSFESLMKLLQYSHTIFMRNPHFS